MTQKWVIWLAIGVAWQGTLLGLRGAAGDQHWDAGFGVPGVIAGVIGVSTVTAIVEVKGEIYVGGEFLSAYGNPAKRIAKWNGTNWSEVGGGVEGDGFPPALVSALLAVDTNLYVAGRFDLAGSVGATNIARWDGERWWPLGSGLNGAVWALANDGTNLYAGGQFTSAGDIPALRLARWDGTSWFALGQVTNADPYCYDGCFDDGRVFALAVKGQDLYVGGRFCYAGDIFTTNLTRWNGTKWSEVGGGVNAQVRALAFLGDELLVAGQFNRAGEVPVKYLAAWDGANWSSLGGGVTENVAGAVSAIAVNGTSAFFGGGFRSVGGVVASGVACWESKLQRWLPLGSGVSGCGVLACTGSELYVGGDFRTAGGSPSTNLALWHIPHALEITPSNRQVIVSWPGTGSNFVLESAVTLGATNWTETSPAPVLNQRRLWVTNDLSVSNRFYRLRRS